MFHARILILLELHPLKQCLGHWLVCPAGRVFLCAYILNACLLVVAKDCQTTGQHHNGVTLHNESLGTDVRHLVEMVSPVSVADSRCTIRDHTDIWKHFGLIDINVGDY